VVSNIFTPWKLWVQSKAHNSKLRLMQGMKSKARTRHTVWGRGNGWNSQDKSKTFQKLP